ncbi:mechanosensitive ion channel [bacterium]|nr:mechanosensitive ion channel [bacterium]
MGSFAELLESIAQVTGLETVTVEKLIATLAILIIAPIATWIILTIVRRRAKDPTLAYRSLVILRYTMSATVIIALLLIWISGARQLATYISIVSAGLVIALQDTVSNLAGFIFILTRKPFILGDRIEIDHFAGDVVDIRAFQFTIVEIKNWVDADQSTGRIVHIPNSKVLREEIANFTTGFEYIWDEVPVLVTFESNWRKAKELLENIARTHCEAFTPEAERQLRKTAQRYMIIAGKLTPIVYTTVRDCGVLLTMRFLTKARQRRGNEQAIWEAILDAFGACPDIDFAYPTTRFYDNRTEGKPEARG